MSETDWPDYSSGVAVYQKSDYGDTDLVWEITRPNGVFSFGYLSPDRLAVQFCSEAWHSVMRYWPREVHWYRGVIER